MSLFLSIKEQKFKSFLRIINQSSFYKKKLENYTLHTLSLNELSSLPFTTKGDLLSVSPYDLIGVDFSEIAHYHESSGTTGKSSSSWFTLEDLKTAGKQLNQMGVELNEKDLVLIRFPFALSCTAFLMQNACTQASAGMLPVSSRSTITPYMKVLELTRKLNVTVFAGLARELEFLIEAARMTGLSVQEAFPNLRAACVAGELLGEQRKKYLEKILGVPVYGFYGSTETANIASMCKHGVMHISEEDFLIEVLDEHTKTPLKLGSKGLLCITTLSHQGSPLLRYINEDIVTVKDANCSCGHLGREIVVHGRAKERISNSSENVLEALDIHEAVYSLEKVPLIWRVIEEEGSLCAIFEYGERPLLDAEKEIIESELSRKLNISVIVKIAENGELIDPQDLVKNTISLKPVYIKPAMYKQKKWELNTTI